MHDDVVAVGGELTPDNVLYAYSQGVFPWPHPPHPLLWFSPDPRFVLEPQHIEISTSLKKAMKKQLYLIQFDTCFSDVISSCSHTHRPHQKGTWITQDIIRTYTVLHQMGFAHSIEAYQDNKLVGGLYGIALGKLFFGESMFATAPNASKIAFATLVAHLVDWGYELIDCQSHTEHLERFGAVHWPKEQFMGQLHRLVAYPTQKGPWKTHMNSREAASFLAQTR